MKNEGAIALWGASGEREVVLNPQNSLGNSPFQNLSKKGRERERKLGKNRKIGKNVNYVNYWKLRFTIKEM